MSEKSCGCCECRQKTSLEIIKEHIKDETELNTVLYEFARLRQDNYSMRRTIERLEKEKQTLTFGLIQALDQQISGVNYAIAKEHSEQIEYEFNNLKESDR